MSEAGNTLPQPKMLCPHCKSVLLWSDDRGAHCDGCDDFDYLTDLPVVYQPTLLQRVDKMLAGIRSDKARLALLGDASRANPMVAAAMGGNAAKIAELRTVNGELAREVVALKAELARRDAGNDKLSDSAAGGNESRS
jgi:hypothetical protein